MQAPKLRWLQEERPADYERTAHVLLPHDYVNFWLTGELAMEVGRVHCGVAIVHAQHEQPFCSVHRHESDCVLVKATTCAKRLSHVCCTLILRFI